MLARSSVPTPTSARRGQRGATLLEVIAYLGIAAIIIVGAVGMLTRAFNVNSANQTAEQIQAMQLNIRKLHAGRGYGPNGTNLFPALNAAGGIPPGLTVVVNGANVNVTNSWGGPVTLTSAAGNNFTITMGAIPQSVCIDILTSLPATSWRGVAGGAAAAAARGLTEAANVAANNVPPIPPAIAAAPHCAITGNAGNFIALTSLN